MFWDENSDKSDDEVATAVHNDDKSMDAHRGNSSTAELLSSIKSEQQGHAEVQEVADESERDPHEMHNQAVQQSRSVLTQMGDLLEENPDCCSPSRREEWNEAISALLSTKEAHAIIGMLGNTGEYLLPHVSLGQNEVHSIQRCLDMSPLSQPSLSDIFPCRCWQEFTSQRFA